MLLRAEIAVAATAFTDHEARKIRAGAFHIFGVDSVVADLRIRHGHDLTTVAGIGEDLLVTGHRGIKDDFARCFSGSPQGLAGIHGTVFEREFGCLIH